MQLRLARPLLALFLGAGWLVVPASPLASTACAQDAPHAVLVVDKGTEGGPLDPMCVRLNDDEVSGKEFLQLAMRQFGLDVQFASYGTGTAVCSIDGVGNRDCLEGADVYWSYWRGDGSGGWDYSSQGIDDSVVHAGDVDGWAWGRGDNSPPHTTFEEGCAELLKEPEPAPQDTPTPQPTPSATPRPSPSPTKNKLPPPEAEPDPRRLDGAPGVSEFEDPLASPTPSAGTGGLPPSATTAGSEDEDEGFPLAGVLALLVTGAMAGVAAYLVRKKTPAPSQD